MKIITAVNTLRKMANPRKLHNGKFDITTEQAGVHYTYDKSVSAVAMEKEKNYKV